MKWLLFFAAHFFLFYASHAQNVGIGTQTPQAKLDVRGNLRTGGAGNFLFFDSSTGRFTLNNAYLYLPATQYIIRHSASAEGLYYTDNRLSYLNSTGITAFFTDWSTGNGYFSGNVGIGMPSPAARLHVNNGGIRIEGPSSGGGNALSIGGTGDVQVDAPFISAGRFVIKENGNIGIGNATPGFPLNFGMSLGDKISLFGNSGSHYGLGIRNNLLQVHTDGVGSDIAFGYGSSSTFTEKFRMKGNGALLVNGNPGQPGQVLTSAGNNSPQWTSGTNALFSNTTSVVDQSEINLTTGNGFVALPGMSYTFSLAGNAKVFLSYVIPVLATSCAFCGRSDVYIELTIDGSYNNRSRWDIENGARQTLSFSKVVSLGAGSHTVQLNAFAIGPSVQFGGCCIYDKILNVQIIPQ